MLNANALVGSHDVLMVTLDTLRYDVAQQAWRTGRTPNLASVLPARGWELRHSPGNFTYAAHQAFFAGFLPTPATPGPHPRLFAVSFPGSETVTSQTCVFDAPDIVTGFAQRGYRTVCIGGVGFFNHKSPLGSVLPGLFQESHWDESFGVTDRRSTENQVALAERMLADLPQSKRVFLFLNVSALHQPNWYYLDELLQTPRRDTLASHEAALVYVDRCLPPLFDAFRRRGRTLGVVCSDHGTAYGEDGFRGHRLGHPVVWNVPYAEFILT